MRLAGWDDEGDCFWSSGDVRTKAGMGGSWVMNNAVIRMFSFVSVGVLRVCLLVLLVIVIIVSYINSCCFGLSRSTGEKY